MGNDSTHDIYNIKIRKKVWAKALILDGHPPDIWRRDRAGNVINWQEYGKKASQYGWKIVNTLPNNSTSADIEHLHPVHNTVEDFNF